MAITITPVAISNPDVPYDKALVRLGITGIIQNNAVQAQIVLDVQKYRVLPDGTLDVSSATPNRIRIPDAFTAAQSDPDLATAVTDIQAAIQTYLTAKGL